ncbi:MAG TPA: ArsI/CadI family heavy metal resistance metalloenzyme [Arenibaculum sp.]|nr:ArsI/CadI family heavy metal resistance metalloenzyme [Arenibaculum sp.]
MSVAAVTLDRVIAGAAVLPNPISDLRPSVELDVKSLDQSVDFYTTLFNAEPVVRERGLARFDLDDPQLSLVLVENPAAAGRDGHFGVQLKYTQSVKDVQARLQGKGVKIDLEEADASCCFSVASKVWVSDPDKNLWEIYVLIASNATEVRCGDSCACEASGCG